MNALTLFLSTSLYYIIHSFLADTSVKQWITKRIIPYRYYRIFYNFVAISLLAPLGWIYFSTTKQPLFNSTIINQTLGVIITIFGIWLTKKAMAQYSIQEFIGLDRLKTKNKELSLFLNTSGLNSWVRHPLYLASLIIFVGALLLFPNSGVLMIVIVSTLYLFVGIRLEEKKLVDTFGEAYLDYQKRVPMIIPRFSNSQNNKQA